ncbi:MAG TPA: PAS domain-containing sensor histidine kinase [Terriglobia bacterium]|nr:PAS domain-containing sensor histidine kinase [Terriglobia bacterium]
MADDLSEVLHEEMEHSRRRYADLYDFAPVGYTSLDEQSRIEEINITGAKLLGETPSKLIGRSFLDFIVPEQVERFMTHLRRSRRFRHKRSIDVRLVTQDGTGVDVQLFTIATHDVDRQTLQFRVAILNITSRRRAEAAVRRQREDAQLFLNEASAVLSASLDWEITLWSLARAAIPHLADACVVDIFQNGGPVRRVAVAHLDPEKERLLWSLDNFSSQAQVFEDLLMWVPLVVRGQTIGFIGLMMERPDRRYDLFDLALAEDLADRAAIALDNAQLYSKEQEASRLKDEFLAVVSHELRTPLTPILGAIYKLRAARPEDEDLQKNLDLIDRNARAQARIVEDLLDISRITTGKFEFHRQQTALLPIVQAAVDLVEPTVKTLGLNLKTSFEETERLVWCDGGRIQQVIWNLLSNAFKFTPRGGSVEIRLESAGNFARISVTDTGAGISKEFLPHVFARFRQASNFATRTQGGLGLGLSIVKYIVEQHGGTVRAMSDGEGQGSTFTVDLPFS